MYTVNIENLDTTDMDDIIIDMMHILLIKRIIITTIMTMHVSCIEVG